MTHLNLESAYLSHAPTPAEVGAYLDSVIELLSQTNGMGFDHLSTRIVQSHISATFNLHIILERTEGSFTRLANIASQIFPDGHMTRDPHRFETAPGFVFSLDSRLIALRHLPRTKEMLSVIRHRLAKTGWTRFMALEHELSELQPLTDYYINRGAALNCCHNYARDASHYPRYLAPLGDYLLTVDTGTLARDVPLYALRELRRLESNEYVPLPDHISRMIPDDIYLREVPHLAIKGSNAGKVAYTENVRKGEADVQSVMKPGKYLRRVLKNQIESDQHLKEMVAELRSNSTFDVKITHDPDEAREVYLTGPDSCMSHGQSRFDETFDLDNNWRHPIEALFFPDGSGTIGLVYVESQGRPAARGLVNTESKEFTNFYIADWAPAARTTLEEWFEENGYSHNEEALMGCRIPRIDLRRDRILCPYIDHGNLGVTIVDDDTLEVGGELQADYQHGYVKEDSNMLLCEECDERYDEDEIRYIDSVGHHVCDTCLADEFVEALDDDGDIDTNRRDDCTDLGFVHSYRGYRFEYVVSDIRQSVLNDHGLCETLHDEICPIDDCYRIEDTGDWIHEDLVASNETAPRHLFCDFLQLDGGTVHQVGDCVWIIDDNKWIHRDDFDEDAYSTHHDGNYLIAELLDEEAA